MDGKTGNAITMPLSLPEKQSFSSLHPSDLHEIDAISRLPEFVCRGGSCIIDPYGHYLTEPVWDKETIIYAELDMSLPAACKMEHDVVGHYARPDILELKINDKSRGVHE